MDVQVSDRLSVINRGQGLLDASLTTFSVAFPTSPISLYLVGLTGRVGPGERLHVRVAGEPIYMLHTAVNQEGDISISHRALVINPPTLQVLEGSADMHVLPLVNPAVAFRIIGRRLITAIAQPIDIQWDYIDINLGGAILNNQVIIPMSGLYYIYMSSGALGKTPLHIQLMLDNNAATPQPVMEVAAYNTQRDGESVYGRGGVWALAQGDRLWLRLLPPTSAFSSEEFNLVTLLSVLLQQEASV